VYPFINIICTDKRSISEQQTVANKRLKPNTHTPTDDNTCITKINKVHEKRLWVPLDSEHYRIMQQELSLYKDSKDFHDVLNDILAFEVGNNVIFAKVKILRDPKV
jgi:hypothetical protein